jgi:quercetin dioxygenase-like cupin family protein
MHVAPVDLRAFRQEGMVVRFSMLGTMAYVLAEIPAGGAGGTALERPCTDPHWGFVLKGELIFVTDREREAIPAGRAFHVPAGGPSHRFETVGAAILAGFAPIASEADVSDDRLAAEGFEPVEARAGTTIVPAVTQRRVAVGRIRAESWPMSPFRLMRVRMGERSGYTAAWCDAPHWGVITSGRLAIEWEDDIEILSTGDVFHCPAGPPGHRIEAADPATFVDLTPVAALGSVGRLAEWRRDPEAAGPQRMRGIAVAALG